MGEMKFDHFLEEISPNILRSPPSMHTNRWILSLILGIILLSVVSCAGGGQWLALRLLEKLGTAPPPALPSIASSNAATYLTIPLYVQSVNSAGSFVVHPSIIDFGRHGWQGHRYWMAITPFTPTEANRVENPTIYYSDDGTAWDVPPGNTNPIDTPDAGWINSDPDLFLGPKDVLYCVYRQYNYNPQSLERLYYRTSADGVHWSERTLITEHMGGADQRYIISPSVVYKDGWFLLWTSNHFAIELRVGTSLTALSPPVTCTFDRPASLYHNDVIWYDNKFRAVIQDGVSNLRYAESYNGIAWSLSPTGFLNLGATGQWDDIWIYRATFTPTATGYDLWYSARGTGAATAFRFGRTQMTLTPWKYVPF